MTFEAAAFCGAEATAGRREALPPPEPSAVVFIKDLGPFSALVFRGGGLPAFDGAAPALLRAGFQAGRKEPGVLGFLRITISL